MNGRMVLEKLVLVEDEKTLVSALLNVTPAASGFDDFVAGKVFLRLLEYYQGVMLLTTNRSTTIDRAFESRIDIVLAYNDLDVDARKQVWKTFIDNLDCEIDISEAELQKITNKELNGRQIKSAIKTAAILASSQGCALNERHIKTVVNIRKRGSKVLGIGEDLEDE